MARRGQLHPERVLMVSVGLFGLLTYTLLAIGYLLGFPGLYRWALLTGAITVLVGFLPLLAFLTGCVIERLSEGPVVAAVPLEPDLIPDVKRLVSRLIRHDFDGLVQDGETDLTAQELREGLDYYPGTFIEVPDDKWGCVDVFPQKKGQWIAVPLWTREEGRSDLYVYIICMEDTEAMKIVDLYVP